MITSTAERKKPLGVRATVEQHRIISEAASREHRSINNFVLRSALEAAEAIRPAARQKRTQAEIAEILKRAQDAMQRANPTGRSLVDELVTERRAASVGE